MYEFARGPLVWIAFAAFIVGSLYKVITLHKLAKKDKVFYAYFNFKYGLRSILHWLIPFGSTNMRMRPGFTLVSFGFHFLLFATPLFALGHIALIRESWGFGWPHLPDGLTNAMTIILIVFGLIFGLRRIANPTVRLISTIKDYLLLLLVLGPFISGMLAYYQVGSYETTITIHMMFGAAWLIAIPFTRLIHMIYFGLSRAYMGSEFGYVRNSKDW